MTSHPLPTKDRLIRAAADLFRSRGYHGVGLAEVLSTAAAPKGSLYHHFPNGKSDLAMAAATWASDGMLHIIAASFEPAETFQDGVTTVSHKLAKLFDKSGKWEGCPVSSTLFEGPDNGLFRKHEAYLFRGWITEIEHHAVRLGLSEDDARRAAEHLFIQVQGGWQLARALQDSDVLRNLPHNMGF